jgi:hypothetical protein
MPTGEAGTMTTSREPPPPDGREQAVGHAEDAETSALLALLALGQQDVDAGRIAPAMDVIARLRAATSRR